MFLLPRLRLSGLLFCCLLFPFSNAKAQKILGADIAYIDYGNDSMEVRLIAYLRCDGKTSNFKPGDLLIKPKTSSPFKVALSLSGGQDISPVPRGKCTSCQDTSCTFKKGIQQFYCTAGLSLKSFSDCEFTFSWQGTGREINGQGIYVDAMYERCAAGSHTSPGITDPPVQVVCKNTRIMHTLPSHAWYPEDSLAYHLIPPRITADTAYSYPSGYDYQNPLTVSADGFMFDMETGMYTFQPTKEESSPIAIRIDVYQKDSTGKPVKIGNIMRDIQFDIVDCGQVNAPLLSGIDCQKPVSITFCANRAQCFTVCSFDADSAKDTVTLSWNNAIPGGKFTGEEGKKFPKGTFCWSPTEPHLRTVPYRFVISAADKGGIVRNRTDKVFSIYVKPAPKGLIKKTYDKNGWVTLEAVVTNGVGIKAYYWNGQYRPRNEMVDIAGGKIKIHYAPDPSRFPTKYPVYVTMESIYGCQTVIVDTVVIDSSLYVDLGADTTVCVNTSLNVKARQYFGEPDYLYSWLVYNDATKTWDMKVNKVKDDTAFSITADRTKHVVVSVIDGKGGEITDTIHVLAKIPPKPFLGADVKGCPGIPVILDARKDKTGQKMPMIRTFQWYKSDGAGGWKTFPNGPTLPLKDSGTYRVLVTDSIGCTGCDTIHLFFFPRVDVVKSTHTVCMGDTAHINGGLGTPTTRWEWYAVDSPASPPVSKISTYDFMPPQTGPVKEWKFRVRAIDEHKADKVDCLDEDTITLILDTTCIRPCTSNLYSKDTSICRGDTISLHASGGTSYLWSPATGVSDTLSANPKIYTSVTRTYSVRIADSVKNCLDTFSVTITVDSNCVWPGDANYDKIADYKDVLAIGVGFGKTGYSRDSVSTAWQPFPSKEWSLKLATGVNYKHIDCDGDSTINLGDLAAVAANYGKTHKKSGEPQSAGVNDPTISVRFAKDTFYASDTVQAELFAGTASNPLDNAYGIGLELEAGAPFIVPGSLQFDFSCNTFCNTANSIPFVRMDGSQVHGALVRTDHIGTDGDHKVGDIQFILRDSTFNYSSTGNILSVAFNELILIDTAGIPIPVNQDIGIVMVLKKRGVPSGVNSPKQWQGEIKVYPNPASDILIVETGAIKVNEITLYNALGQQVYRIEKTGESRIQIPVSGFMPGMYFISVNGAEGTAVKKFIIR